MVSTTQRLGRRSVIKAGLASTGGLLGIPLLSACGTDDSPPAVEAAEDTPEEPPEEPPAGGTLVLGTTFPERHMDAVRRSNFNRNTFYSSLIDYGPNFEVSPAVAEEWEIASDNRSVVIKLRETTFHSGAPVTADDVIAGVERVKNPEESFFLGGPSAFIDSAVAIDERTVQIDFNEPAAEATILDWMFLFPVVEADRNEAALLDDTPAGSGPFEFVSWTPDRNLVMKRNPNFWDEGKPHLDEVEFRFFTDGDALIAALETGDVHGAVETTFRFGERLRDRFTLIDGPAGEMRLLFMNPSMPPFDNKMLRQAVARAIDRERIGDVAYFGFGDPIYTALMPNSPAFDPSILGSHGFDLDAAEAMLDASGGAREAECLVAPAPGFTEMAQIIQDDLQKIGFQLTLMPMEQQAFSQAVSEGSGQCVVRGNSPSLRTPANIAAVREMRVDNNPIWTDGVPRAYVEALDATRATVTEQEQQDAYRRLNEVLVDEAWAVGAVAVPRLTIVSPEVTGFTTTPLGPIVLTDVRLGG